MRPLLLIIALAATPAAQTVSPDLERANPSMRDDGRAAVRRQVERFLDRLGNRDVAAVRGLLAPKALIAIARQQPDGSFATGYQTREEFLAQLEKAASQPAFREPITDVEVTIDEAHLAHVRARFTIERDGKVLSSGVDHFVLLREPDGWKIAVIAYTSVPGEQP